MVESEAQWNPEALEGWLTDLDPGEVRLQEDMSGHTSMQVGGPADALVFPRDRETLARTLRLLREKQVPWVVIGRGGGVLVREGGFAGVILSTTKLVHLEVLDPEAGRLYCEAGVEVASIVREGLEEGFGDVGRLSGIMGTVGGTIRKNVRTPDGEIHDLVESVEVMTPSGRVQEVDADKLRSSWQKSGWSRDWVLVGATLRLGPAKREWLEGGRREHLQRRVLPPSETPSVEQVFRDVPPSGKEGPVPAERLIGLCGLQGVRIRGARVSEQHANRIVNVGGARADDVLLLIRLIRDRVKAEQGVLLDSDVCVIGRPAVAPGTGRLERHRPAETPDAGTLEHQKGLGSLLGRSDFVSAQPSI